MKLRLFSALLLAGLLTAAAAFARQPVDELYDKAEYRIAMRDSVKLYTAVYTPKTDAKAPILIFRTPYGCAPYGPGEFPRGFGSGYMRSYIDRGYIVVMQDVRGRFMSEGEFVHVRPAGYGETDETTDSYDTVEWLVKHVPHNNGRVGFAGSSYPGFYAMMGGLCTHPAVKAVSPQAPVTDWFMGDDVRHNGVLMLTDSYRFLSGMNTPPGHTPTEKMPPMSKRTRPDEWSFFREHATLAELTELQRPNPFWEELAEHPSYDAWWQARDLRRACYNVQPAVLVVGGTFDAEDCFGAWNLYRAMVRQSPATPCHLVVGPWAHGAWRNGSGKLGALWSISNSLSSTITSRARAPRTRFPPPRFSRRATTAGMLSTAGRRAKRVSSPSTSPTADVSKPAARRPKAPPPPIRPIRPIPCPISNPSANAAPKSICSPTSASCRTVPMC